MIVLYSRLYYTWINTVKSLLKNNYFSKVQISKIASETKYESICTLLLNTSGHYEEQTPTMEHPGLDFQTVLLWEIWISQSAGSCLAQCAAIRSAAPQPSCPASQLSAWDQLLLVPTACDLKPQQLMCRSLTRSSRSIHLLLIPCRHQSQNAQMRTHTHTHTWCGLCHVGSSLVLPAGFVWTKRLSHFS